MKPGPFAYFFKVESPDVAFRIPIADAVSFVEVDAFPCVCWIGEDAAFQLPRMVLLQATNGNLHAVGETGFGLSSAK